LIALFPLNSTKHVTVNYLLISVPTYFSRVHNLFQISVSYPVDYLCTLEQAGGGPNDKVIRMNTEPCSPDTKGRTVEEAFFETGTPRKRRFSALQESTPEGESKDDKKKRQNRNRVGKSNAKALVFRQEETPNKSEQELNKQYHEKYHSQNREKRRQRFEANYAKNREERLAGAKANYAENKEQ